MVKKIKNAFKKINIKRTTLLLVAFAVMSLVLIQRLFSLQIIRGQEYANNFSLRTTKERTLKSTRGNILDRNGNILANNELSYSVTLEDSGTYGSTKERNLSLNGEIYKLIQIIEDNGDSIDHDFHIVINENGEYDFDVTEFQLERFRADIYGYSLIDDLKPEEAGASAKDIMSYLSGSKRFSLVLEKDKTPYTEEELGKYGLPEEFTKEELLKMVTVRYILSTTSYKKYMPVTIATNVSADTVASVMENQNLLEGADIQEDSVRVYTDSIYFSSILGYTGKASSDELETLKEENPNYSTSSIIGKTGIEEVMETTLQGTDGSETVYVDNLGKVLQIDQESKAAPVQGNDVYLTIDKELQSAVYQILEQRIAGILTANITPAKTFEADDNTDSSMIPIPIYDVYNALINNSLININHFSAADASETEHSLQAKFETKQSQIFDVVTQELMGDAPLAYKDLAEEMQTYISYIVNTMLMHDTQILSETSIDKSDPTYIAWAKDETISLQEYLTYAASQNWIDISPILDDTTYLNAKEAYQSLSAYIADYLKTDTAFSKLLYKYMLLEDTISGTELCTVLYDQGILTKEDESYAAFISGQMSSYDLMIEKIKLLEITPAQLALDPCSGSVVITDPNSGEIRACVTYPGYDNNRLANQMDAAYYTQLNNDLSEPFYNKATQQRTAPGSTFKIVTTVASLTEGVIDDDTTITCNGRFEKIAGSELKCWELTGHGPLSIRGAIQNSCNVFFSEVAYRLGLDESEVFSDTAALQKLDTYAKLFDFDKNSGIEISEAAPQISDELPIPSAIGQGTHSYTTSQLARYVTTIANSGTSYNISLLDKTTNPDGKLIEDFTPHIESKLEVDQDIWDDIHVGMRGVITITEANKEVFEDLGVSLAGKTGTAQQKKGRANHGLFIGYAPYEEPEIAMAVRIAYGYSSRNAGLVAKDICNYYFDLKAESEILTGTAEQEGTSNAQTD